MGGIDVWGLLREASFGGAEGSCCLAAEEFAIHVVNPQASQGLNEGAISPKVVHAQLIQAAHNGNPKKRLHAFVLRISVTPLGSRAISMPMSGKGMGRQGLFHAKEREMGGCEDRRQTESAFADLVKGAGNEPGCLTRHTEKRRTFLPIKGVR
ncbi:hypothetical protein DUNSADRAFT_7975 [Dunaliella salina]|uniref:Encoded protein n=1 Tax=Dunaliella salina TaxID=3046 RepID=A0ABQ7H649_DUNSA|nr:hypothetical protein DUNSADRAFT_7975 [Dunaliella salina]|eukprot:KAF5842323.1 hypothetical protein DUNSADRAFT_7975 [Dunaliella salina]